MSTQQHIAALAFLIAAPAVAQAPPGFPADEAFTPVGGGDPITFADALGDASKPEIDIVGDDANPAIGIASSHGFLFLRMRLDGDPCATRSASGCVDLKPFGWVFAFDADGSTDAFENLVEVGGNSGQSLEWRRNTIVTSLNDPNEKAEVLVTSLTPVPSWFEVTSAGSTFGGTPDFFLTLALDCADFESEPQLVYGEGGRVVPQGQTAGAPMPLYSCGGPIHLWAGTDTNKQNIAGDISFAGATGTLSGTESPPVVPPPVTDFDGDGLPDSVEDANGNGIVDPGETDPFNPDTDGDGFCDGPNTVAGVCIGGDPAPLDPCIPDPSSAACLAETGGEGEGEGATSGGEGEGATSGEGEGASGGEGEGATSGEGEGEGASASGGEGEGATSGEGEGASASGGEGEGEGASASGGEGEGATSGEGEGASAGEGEGATTSGEGEGASASEGEGASGGEGEGATSGDGEGEGATASEGEGEGDVSVVVPGFVSPFETSTTSTNSCTSAADCSATQTCIDGACVARARLANAEVQGCGCGVAEPFDAAIPAVCLALLSRRRRRR